MTSAEFVEYLCLFEKEANEKRKTREKAEHYWAAMTAEMRRSWVRDPSKVNEKSFLLEFLTEEEALAQQKEKQQKVDPEVEKARRVAMEKASWGIITGHYLKNKNVKKRKSKHGRPTGTANPRSSPDAQRQQLHNGDEHSPEQG